MLKHDTFDLLVHSTDELESLLGEPLAERHLGTIYEGLLEYHLQPILPAVGWSIDLFNERGERHRTGSYYTPDFVVQYIVDQTLKPVVATATDNGPRTSRAWPTGRGAWPKAASTAAIRTRWRSIWPSSRCGWRPRPR